MNILIKGIKMPKNCEECDAKALCKNYWRRVREKYTRPSWCPLFLVPPHGRLIDADALWVEINKICDRRDAGIIADLTCIQQILSALRHAPTIISADQSNVETEMQQEYLQNWHKEGET